MAGKIFSWNGILCALLLAMLFLTVSASGVQELIEGSAPEPSDIFDNIEYSTEIDLSIDTLSPFSSSQPHVRSLDELADESSEPVSALLVASCGLMFFVVGAAIISNLRPRDAIRSPITSRVLRRQSWPSFTMSERAEWRERQELHA